VQRTHGALRAALLALILERGWEDTTVQDVCERANVGRSTFYLHFADKEELLVSGFGDLPAAMRKQAAAGVERPLAYARALLEHAQENERFFRALVGRRTAQVVYRAFMDVVHELLDGDLDPVVAPGPLRKASVRFLGGALWELIMWWGEQTHRATPLEIEAIFHKLAMPVLRELGRSKERKPG
jgi:AcrR family transcriptional regulator